MNILLSAAESRPAEDRTPLSQERLKRLNPFGWLASRTAPWLNPFGCHCAARNSKLAVLNSEDRADPRQKSPPKKNRTAPGARHI